MQKNVLQIKRHTTCWDLGTCCAYMVHANGVGLQTFYKCILGHYGDVLLLLSFYCLSLSFIAIFTSHIPNHVRLQLLCILFETCLHYMPQFCAAFYIAWLSVLLLCYSLLLCLMFEVHRFHTGS